VLFTGVINGIPCWTESLKNQLYVLQDPLCYKTSFNAIRQSLYLGSSPKDLLFN